jgi:Tautomerase enzyme
MPNDRFLVLQHEGVWHTLSRPRSTRTQRQDAFPGRCIQAKRALYQAMVANLAPLGIPRNHLLITLRDIPLTDWGVRGGQAACDVDVGFDLKV